MAIVESRLKALESMVAVASSQPAATPELDQRPSHVPNHQSYQSSVNEIQLDHVSMNNQMVITCHCSLLQLTKSSLTGRAIFPQRILMQTPP